MLPKNNWTHLKRNSGYYSTCHIDCPACAVDKRDKEWLEHIEGQRKNRPTIVCLCGSTRYPEAYRKAMFDETMKGNIVVTIGCNMRTDADLFAGYEEENLTIIKEQLDELHLRKIDLADEVLILNVGGYIGKSTRNELQYAEANNKVIRFLEPPIERS